MQPTASQKCEICFIKTTHETKQNKPNQPITAMIDNLRKFCQGSELNTTCPTSCSGFPGFPEPWPARCVRRVECFGTPGSPSSEPIWGFPWPWGYPHSWMVYGKSHPFKWMRTGYRTPMTMEASIRSHLSQ